MKVLVATTELQGHDERDYAHTVEGELVIAEATECANPNCGCGRGFPGLASNKATTTAMIADLPHVTSIDLRTAIADWLDRSGWVDLLRSAAEAEADDHTETGFDDEMIDAGDVLDAIVDDHLELITRVCDAFPGGTVVERSGTLIRARTVPFAA